MQMSVFHFKLIQLIRENQAADQITVPDCLNDSCVTN